MRRFHRTAPPEVLRQSFLKLEVPMRLAKNSPCLRLVSITSRSRKPSLTWVRRNRNCSAKDLLHVLFSASMIAPTALREYATFSRLVDREKEWKLLLASTTPMLLRLGCWWKALWKRPERQ